MLCSESKTVSARILVVHCGRMSRALFHNPFFSPHQTAIVGAIDAFEERGILLTAWTLTTFCNNN
jgi:NADH/NAD ratio-sensing transcriptional regulator Rex